jgi:regulator of sigma E protease
VGPAERLKRSLAAEDFDTAEKRLAEFAERAREAGVPPQQIEKHVQDLQDALSPQAYWRAPVWKRVAAIGAGPVTNLLFAVVLFAIVFMTAGWSPTSNVATVLKGSKGHPTPAQASGLRPGDSVIAVNGVGADASKISDLISASHGKPIVLTVIRKGEVLNLNPERPRKGSDGRYRLGFSLAGQPLGFSDAVWQSIKTTGYVARDTVKALGGIFHKKDRRQFSSVVGIGNQTREAVQYGWASYLSILAFISLSLGLLNLLPLLPLDGGHIAFSLLEGIRGRAIAREIYERVSAVGIAVVLLLFVIGLSNDVGRFG